MNKPRLIATVAAVMLCTSAGVQAKDKITFATYLEPAHMSAFWPLIAGKVKSDLVDVEVKNLPIAVAGQAMATRQYDIFEIGALSIEEAAERGLDLKLVGTGLRYKGNPAGFGVWVAANSPYKTVADLKGKKVGSYGFKSSVFAWQRIALKDKYHVNVELNGGDFQFVQLPAPNLPAALQTGRIDAATFSHLQSYEARHNKDFRQIVHSGKDIMEIAGVPIVTAVLVAYPDKLAAQPKAYQEALRLLKASSEYAKAHPDEVYSAVAKETKVPQDFFVDWHANYGEFPISIADSDIKAMQMLYEQAKELGLAKKSPDFKTVVWDGALRE